MDLAGRNEEQASKILNLWLDSKTLIQAQPFKTGQRHEIKTLTVDPAKVAAILAQHTPPQTRRKPPMADTHIRALIRASPRCADASFPLKETYDPRTIPKSAQLSAQVRAKHRSLARRANAGKAQGCPPEGGGIPREPAWSRGHLKTYPRIRAPATGS